MAQKKEVGLNGDGRKPVELQGRFPERLYQARRAQNWSQSALAREIWGTTTDSRGYTVAKNRDRISAYESGKSFPERENLERLAEVLGYPVEELAPEYRASGGARSAPSVNMTVVDATRGLAHLTVDVIVPFEVAVKVTQVLSEGGAQSATDGGENDG